MVNVSSAASYIFIIGAFSFFIKKDPDCKFRIYKNYCWTVALTILVEAVIGAGIVFTVVEPILQGDYMSAFWTAMGPVVFGLIAYIFYKLSEDAHHFSDE